MLKPEDAYHAAPEVEVDLGAPVVTLLVFRVVVKARSLEVDSIAATVVLHPLASYT